MVKYVAPDHELGVRFPARPYCKFYKCGFINWEMEKRGKSRTGLYVVLVVILLVVIGGAIAIVKFVGQGEGDGSEIGQSGQVSSAKLVLTKATDEDFNRFEDIISRNKMIQDLPKDGVLELSFYNDELGWGNWERVYTITKGEVREGEAQNYDINLIMNSKYLSALDENNFCLIVRTAKNNGDFSSETEMSTFSLGWKYKSMMNYKSCLGL